ncbi:hypothetical protein AKJ41_05585 [candidate division MSBL1 archaeon SCGC-AAA259O05]|uniref:Protein AKJ41_05585 n=1 Tax=candidate division MSBL1 archaeon SCGC-AAA259O05 TaxID=1698271 RepID=A0A133UYR2_9EURY|nr:hypothetical protein AKJ41_05585 [candidate division MSBL1 archaeon SCGC-AAA259O05]
MLGLEEGKKAVEIARETIETYLKEGRKPDPPGEIPEKFREDRGVFVTLNKSGSLRGCIGRPLPDQPLIDGLMDSAINAATSDSRFPSVGEGELKNISIEVSVLTVPDKVEVDDPKELPEKVRVGRDGLIARYRSRAGLLLPQVPVDNDWDAEEFLSQTCVKAGLSPDAWVKGGVEFEKFSAQVFGEKEPGGEVVEKGLG